jgi:putative DNA primase/helicase
MYCLANASTVAADVADAMTRYGMEPLNPSDIRTDGILCRFDCNGDRRGKRNGWAVVFADGMRPVATFGHWARGVHETVVLGKAGPMTKSERERAAMAADAARREREHTIKQSQERARREANARWVEALPAPASHPYLTRKRITADGLRVSGTTLLVPMRDHQGVLRNLQQILPNGNKRFLAGGQAKACFASIGKAGDHFLLCEGWATGASLHAATGLPVAVCFSAGNLRHVGLILREKYPEARLTFAADNDVHPERANVGVESATVAASLVGGFVATPPIPGDWNDAINADAAFEVNA